MYIHWKSYENNNIQKAKKKTKYKRLWGKVQNEILGLNKYEPGKVKCIKCFKYFFVENMYQVKKILFECKEHTTLNSRNISYWF